MKLRKPITALVAALLAVVFSFAATPLGAAKRAPPPAAKAIPLVAAEPVRLASLEWAPYIGSRLPDQGYVAALVRAAFADQGLTVEIGIYPWARALQMARTGAVDGLVPEYFNRSRESEFEFSAAFPGGPLVLYKRRGDAMGFSADPVRNQEAALQALRARRFGVVRGYLNTPVFDAAHYLIKEEARDDATNLRKLVYGRIDLAVIDRRVAEHIIRTRYPNFVKKIEPMEPPLAELPLFIAFSRKSPRMAEALTAFNRGLAAMRADGRLAALRERYMVKPPNAR